MTTPADMPAGTDLDRLVAERVMVWRLTRPGERFWVINDGKPHPRGYIRASTDWSPSTAIADAWLVVERMLPREVRIVWSAEHSLWLANFGHQWMNDLGDTAPLAICRAALQAVSP